MRATADCRYRSRRATWGRTAVHKKPQVQGDHYAEACRAVEPDIFCPPSRPKRNLREIGEALGATTISKALFSALAIG